jgi:hypothetical protein
VEQVSAAGPPRPVLTFAGAREAAADARRFVVDELAQRDVRPETVDDVRTVATELVVEALSRGRMPRRLVLACGPRHVRVDLRAEGRCPPLAVDTHRRTSQEIVDGLCVATGSRPLDDGRRWWAVVER